MSGIATAQAGFTPEPQDVAEVMAWFAHYDELVAAKNLEEMADCAVFPVNEVTDDADGNGLVSATDRGQFIDQMTAVVGAPGEVQMQSERHPVFINRSLCFVVTDATFTAGDQITHMRYGDLLVRTPSGWKFQTMVAGGWHAHV